MLQGDNATKDILLGAQQLSYNYNYIGGGGGRQINRWAMHLQSLASVNRSGDEQGNHISTYLYLIWHTFIGIFTALQLSW